MKTENKNNPISQAAALLGRKGGLVKSEKKKKICGKCKIEKSINEFYIVTRNRDNLFWCCKDCARKSAMQWKK
jgi:hypothetical protein